MTQSISGTCETDGQQTDRWTMVKQYAPGLSIWGHKKAPFYIQSN